MRRFQQGVDTHWRLHATHRWELFAHNGAALGPTPALKVTGLSAGPPSAGNWHPGSYAPDYRIYSAVWRRRIPAAKTSRMLTTPVRLRPSKTGRWRNPFVSIRWAASSVVVSGLAVTGSLVIH
jgi:hypothetical protein